MSAKVIPFRRGKDEREFLPAALEIVDTPASPAGRAVAAVIVAALGGAILWASLGSIDVIATASGKLVPLGRVKTVQPFETGVVRAIHVKDGDHVQAGQPLVSLDPTQALADRDRFARDLTQARLALARQEGLWQALHDHAAPHLVDPPANLSADSREAAEAALQAIFAEQAAKLAQLDGQIVGKQAEAATEAATIVKLKGSLPMLQDEEQVRAKAMAGEYGNRIGWLQAAERASDQKNDITVAERRQEAALAAAQALERQRDATAAEYAKTTLAERDKDRAQVSELEASLAKAEQRLQLDTLAAPISGTIQQLAIHTVGGVVTPAQPLLTVVPDSAEAGGTSTDGGGLEVEAMVQNRDIGFVHPGQTVALKVETFTFTRYGLIDGTVTGLSRDGVTTPGSEGNGGKRNSSADGMGPDAGSASTGEGGEPVYVAHISLGRTWMDTETGRVALEPGMAVTAEIKTGQRKAIDFLLSPVSRLVKESGHER